VQKLNVGKEDKYKQVGVNLQIQKDFMSAEEAVYIKAFHS
jgi:hypothetical protein